MASMFAMSRLHEVDLNLWVVLGALLETGSVTASAQRLGRTQSAVSHSLASLRRLLGDPLFIRVGAKLQPTPRALGLAPHVHTALESLSRSLAAPEAFDPARLKRTFRLMLSDYAQVVLLPGLVDRLAREAPGVALDVSFRSDAMEEHFRALTERRVDALVAPDIAAGSGVVRRKLFDDHNVCVLRAGHPAAKRLTVEAFAAAPHVQVSPRGLVQDHVDEALAARGLSRRIVIRVPHFDSGPHLVADSDAITLLPARLAARWTASPRVVVKEPPLPLPGFSLALYFAEVMRKEPEHVWLRELLVSAAEERPAPSRRTTPRSAPTRRASREP